MCEGLDSADGADILRISVSEEAKLSSARAETAKEQLRWNHYQQRTLKTAYRIKISDELNLY
jgi:hypothetical protein